MKVFISWSGPISRQIAKSFYDWLPNVLQNVEPFMSSEDIEKGARWLSSMTTELQDCHFGLICLTPENLTAPWIHFEAGSLSKIIDRSRLVPILFNLEPSDIQGPLTQFQMVNFGQEDIYQLLQSINSAGEERKLDEGRLEKIFRAFWPELAKNISKIAFIPLQEHHASSEGPEEGIRPILEEILVVTRSQSISSSKPLEYIIGQLGEHAVLLREIIRSNKVWFRIYEEVRSLSTDWLKFVNIWSQASVDGEETQTLAECVAQLEYRIENLVAISGGKPNAIKTRVRPASRRMDRDISQVSRESGQPPRSRGS